MERKKNKMMFGSAILLALILITPSAFAFFSVEGLIPNFFPVDTGDSSMTTKGTSVVTANPDGVEVGLGIEVIKDTAGEAGQEAAKTMKEIRTRLNESGLEYEVENLRYSIGPHYNYSKDEGRQLQGYKVVHLLKIKTNNTEEIGKIIDAASAGGVNRVQGVSFTLSDEKRDELESKALSLAAKKAKTKADAITSALGLEIKTIKQIHENAYPQHYGGVYMTMEKAVDAAAVPPTEIEASKVSVSATVSIVFEFG